MTHLKQCAPVWRAEVEGAVKVTFGGAREHLDNFEFRAFFVSNLGWGDATVHKEWQTFNVGAHEFARRAVAALDGVLVFEVRAASGRIPTAEQRIEVLQRGPKHFSGALVIFLDDEPERAIKSLWCWALRQEERLIQRFHLHVRGEPMESLLSKLAVMHADLAGQNERANVHVLEIAGFLKKKLDLGQLIAQFHADFQRLHALVMADLGTWPTSREKRWFSSVFLAKLMIVHLLQKSGRTFHDSALMEEQFEQSKLAGKNHFYGILSRGIFAALFRPHALEVAHPDILISDRTFDEIFAVLGQYRWHLSDLVQANEQGINYEVLGYVFDAHVNEKSTREKSTGTIYTPPILVNYLCAQTIQLAIFERLETFDGIRRFSSFEDLLLEMDEETAERLVNDVVPSTHILDPACGSGGCLDAALKIFFMIYLAVVAPIKRSEDAATLFLRKIATNNLHGVDLSEEAVELTQLRLWLALTAMENSSGHIGPFSTFRFDVHCGNSLFGFLKERDTPDALDQALFEMITQLEIEHEGRKAELVDIQAERPFHWSSIFDEPMNRFGGFDAIVTNPPWLEDESREDADDVKARLRFTRLYYARAPDYSHQGRTNRLVYPLFLERIFGLLRGGGKAGVLIPSGFLSESNTMALRRMLLECGDIRLLLGISNEKLMFATLHPMFKSCMMVFGKGQATGEFRASFDVDDLGRLDLPLGSEGLFVRISGDLIRQVSPNSLAIIEFRSETDIQIVQKMRTIPPLEEQSAADWNLKLQIGVSFGGPSEQSVPDWLRGMPIFDGRTISQYTFHSEAARRMVENKVRRMRGKPEDVNAYRLVCRNIGSSTLARSMIATIAPRNVVCSDNLLIEVPGSLDAWSRFYLLALLNSFVIDYWIRQRSSFRILISDVYDLPIPSLKLSDVRMRRIALRASKLVCVSPDFDDLAREVGLRGHPDGIRDGALRAQIRAEIDGLVAHLYALSERELLHVLSTFPRVPDPEKLAVHNAYRDVQKGLLR